MGQGCRLLEQCQNLALGHWVAGCLSDVRTYLTGTLGQGAGCLGSAKPTSQALWSTDAGALWSRGANCLSVVRNYIQGTVGQVRRLLKGCREILPGHCGAGVQAVIVVSEPISRAL